MIKLSLGAVGSTLGGLLSWVRGVRHDLRRELPRAPEGRPIAQRIESPFDRGIRGRETLRKMLWAPPSPSVLRVVELARVRKEEQARVQP